MEELLALMAAEDEDDGQEVVPALVKQAALAVFPQEEGEAAGAGADGRLTAETGREAGQDAVERLAEDRQATEENLEGALAWMAGGLGWEAEAGVRRQAAEALGQAVEALDAVRMEAAAAGRGAGDGGELTGAVSRQEAGTGLERLYRQTVRASVPAAPALPAGAAGRAVRAEEPGSAASLAVEELDRAVRRDSRRYDGGMSIF